MDIYILHEGQQTGPHSEKTARQLIEQGAVDAAAPAWRNGMGDWEPLEKVLNAPAQESKKDAPAPEAPAAVAKDTLAADTAKSNAATPKQKALLSFLGISLPADLTRDQAALMVNDAMENPENGERLVLWNEERLRLHPDLFAAEIQTKKENRASRFFELCQTTGADYFTGITKAHCQVLVGFLDVKFPHWDARESEAAEHYFFPAVAEKFPQLVQKQWRGRLQYHGHMKIAPEIVRRSPTAQLKQTATSPLVAVSRGLAVGLLILAVLYLGYRTMHQDATAAAITPAAATVSSEKPSAPAPAPAPAAVPAPAPAVAAVPPEASAPPAVAPAPAPAPVEPVATLPPLPAPTVPVAMADPGMSPAPMAADPTMAALPGAPAPMAGIPTAVPPPAMAPGADAPPMATLPDPAAMAPGSPAVANAPMATLPGSEPPVPVPAPPATMPTPTMLPASIPDINPTTPPATPAPAPAVVTPPLADPFPSTPAAKTNLVLTKGIEVPLQYGKIVLPAGTAVKLVSRQGGIVKVSYQNSVISIPVSSTDLE